MTTHVGPLEPKEEAEEEAIRMAAITLTMTGRAIVSTEPGMTEGEAEEEEPVLCLSTTRMNGKENHMNDMLTIEDPAAMIEEEQEEEGQDL